MASLVEVGGFQKIQYLQNMDEKFALESQLNDIDERFAQLALRREQIKNESQKIDFEIDFDEVLEKELLLQNRITILKKSIENINQNQKKCIELFYFEGFCYSEIVNKTTGLLFKLEDNAKTISQKIKLFINSKIDRKKIADFQKKFYSAELNYSEFEQILIHNE